MVYFSSHPPEIRKWPSYIANALKYLLNKMHFHRKFLCGLVILSVTESIQKGS